MTGRLITLLAGLLCLTCAASVTIKGTTFTRSATVGDQRLPLRGAGHFTWKLLIDVYAAALYLPEDVAAKDVFDDVPKQLTFHYFREFEAEDFISGADKLLARNLTAGEREAIAGEILQINALYEDIAPGDRYRLLYEPDKGTTLIKNDQVLGTVSGAAFARSYFRIWLGAEPISKGLRDDLLDR